MSAAISRNAKRFLDANKVSPVVSGAVIGDGGQGARYTLKDGKTFTLSRDDCRALGVPRWDRHE